MNILVISPYVPSRHAGHGTATFMGGLLERLAPGHEVTLATFCDDAETAFVPELEQAGIHVEIVRRSRGMRPSLVENGVLAAQRGVSLVRSIGTWTPYYAVKWRDARMLRLVERLTSERRFDIVQCELAFMAEYARAARSGKIVLHEHDLAFRPAYRKAHRQGRGAARFAATADWCMWARYELAAARAADTVLTVTEQDRRLLMRLTNTDNVSYLPRAVDAVRVRADDARDGSTVVFVGSFSHHPNVDAALSLIRDVAPRVLARCPAARFVVAGKNPPASVVAAASAIPAVTIAGFVPDVDGLLRRATVFAAPLHFGGGIKIKILHAMACAAPVVTTAVGMEGIEGAVPGGSILVERTADGLAGHICGLLEDPARARSIGLAGHEVVSTFYSWDRVVRRLEEIYSDTLLKEKQHG